MIILLIRELISVKLIRSWGFSCQQELIIVVNSSGVSVGIFSLFFPSSGEVRLCITASLLQSLKGIVSWAAISHMTMPSE
jgi:hypothetical protein